MIVLSCAIEMEVRFQLSLSWLELEVVEMLIWNEISAQPGPSIPVELDIVSNKDAEDK